MNEQLFDVQNEGDTYLWYSPRRASCPPWPDRWCLVPIMYEIHATALPFQLLLQEGVFQRTSVEVRNDGRCCGRDEYNRLSPHWPDLYQPDEIAKYIFKWAMEVSSWSYSRGELHFSSGRNDEGCVKGGRMWILRRFTVEMQREKNLRRCMGPTGRFCDEEK